MHGKFKRLSRECRAEADAARELFRITLPGLSLIDSDRLMRLILLLAVPLAITLLLSKYTYKPVTDKQTAQFAGVWVERNPPGDHPIRVKFTPRGSQLEVSLSVSQVFGENGSSIATIKDNKATIRQRTECGKSYQHPGYNYDNPGETVWSFSPEETTGSGYSPRLFFTVETNRTVPCGDRTAGTERMSRVLEREEASPTLSGQVAPDFALPDLDGHAVKLSSLRGKVVLLDFWATWCVPCRQALPFTELLHRSLREKGLVVLGVDNELAQTTRNFVTRHGYTFPTLIDAKESVTKQFHVEGFPTTIVIDGEGKVAYLGLGHDAEKLRNVLRRLGVW
jgi:peroxiredoxin